MKKLTKKRVINRSETKSTKKTTAKTVAKKPVAKSTGKKTTTKTKKTTNIVKKDEFRTNKKNGHPSYIYKKVNGRYQYIGLTHSEITDGVKNIKLEKNPNPNDKKTTYMRPKSSSSKTKNFKQKKVGWKLSPSDKKTAEKIANKTQKT